MASGTLHLFEAPVRRPRRVMMHVVDAGSDMVNHQCQRCGYDDGWKPTRAVSEEKRGRPCPKCNDTAEIPDAS